MSRRMFAGELEGELVLLYMGFRANEVRQSISELFFVRGEGPQSAGALNYSWAGRKRRWQMARKAGWRVVPVVVARASVPKPVNRAPKYRHGRGIFRGPTAAECALNRAWDQVG